MRDLTVRRINRKWGEILVPKAGWVRFRISRAWTDIRAATSARIALANGRMFHAPGFSAGEQVRFVALQRRLSRQLKGSANRERTKAKLGSGEIPVHKVGSHTRLKADDVLTYRERMREQQRAAIRKLREFEDAEGLDY